jgi:urease accessory protein
MLRAERLERAGHWAASEIRGSVTLAYEARSRRRAVLRTDAGEELLLDLARATLLQDGDGLALAGGGWIEVRAAPEPLIEIRTPSPTLSGRLAWHLGNRHLPAQIEAERILIRPDHVIEAMLEGLGARLLPAHEPFCPEGGAYAGHHLGAAHHHAPR